MTAFNFSRPSKSALTYQLLTLLNSGRLKLYAASDAPQAIVQESWQQLQKARYRLPAPDILDFYVEALNAVIAPAASTLIRPTRLYAEEGRF